MKYKYEPGTLDKFDPKVIRGYPIKPGSVVNISKRKVDPCGYFRWIIDENGNEQSVFKQALVPIK